MFRLNNKKTLITFFVMFFFSFLCKAEERLSKYEEFVLQIVDHMKKIGASEDDAILIAARIVSKKGISGNPKNDYEIRKEIFNNHEFMNAYLLSNNQQFILPFLNRCFNRTSNCQKNYKNSILKEVMRSAIANIIVHVRKEHIENLVKQNDKLLNDESFKIGLDDFQKNQKGYCFLNWMDALKLPKEKAFKIKEKTYKFFNDAFTEEYRKSLSFTTIKNKEDLIRFLDIECSSFVIKTIEDQDLYQFLKDEVAKL